jgi:hypothetical protein
MAPSRGAGISPLVTTTTPNTYSFGHCGFSMTKLSPAPQTRAGWLEPSRIAEIGFLSCFLDMERLGETSRRLWRQKVPTDQGSDSVNTQLRGSKSVLPGRALTWWRVIRLL